MIIIREAMCATCGFETFVSDYETMERIHGAFDGAHEPNWWAGDEPYRHNEIHILSATELIHDGFRGHVTHCSALFTYGTATDQYVIGNYAGSRGATCPTCVADYDARYGRKS